MKTFYTPSAVTVLFILILSFASCNEDFNTLNSDVVSQDLALIDTSVSVRAYSVQTQGLQTNNLPVYQLGVYNDPVFGTTKAHFLAQVNLSQTNPTFGDSVKLNAVVLNLPFFNTSVEEEDGTTYTLDSIFGDNPMRITILESGYFLRETDPNSNFEDPQAYFSNQTNEISSFIVSGGENNLEVVLDNFRPRNEADEIIIPNDSTPLIDTLSFQPGINVMLPISYFEDKIIAKQGEPELLNNTNFRDYFRGLLFKVEDLNAGNSMAIFNPEAGEITLHYTNQTTSSNGEVQTNKNEYVLNFSGINVNLFEGALPPQISQTITETDTLLGAERIYLKSGENAAVGIIKLFDDTDLDGNQVSDQLDALREKRWLINDAQLLFYVDQNTVSGGATEPERIQIFDAKNGQILSDDYNFDLTATNDPVDAVTTHLGRLERGSDQNGDFYKIRITNHINNLINNDSINVPLGLVISQNVLVTSFQDIETPVGTLEVVPSASIIAPEGTVLHGNLSENDVKKLKLIIHYTEIE